MKHGRKITISTAPNRWSKDWKNQEMAYADFVERLRTPVRSMETLEEFLKLPKGQQDDLKDVGGFVGGALRGSRRKASNVESRDLITLDFDNMMAGDDEKVLGQLDSLGCGYVVYSTRKHTEHRPRLRIIIPLDHPVTADEYEPIARRLAKTLGIGMADPSTFEPSRLMYWPSCSADSTYFFKAEDRPLLSAKKVLDTYADWKDVASWPQVPGADTSHRREITRQEDPLTKPGLVGAFCRTYDIYEALDHFIPKAYDRTGHNGRLTYLQGSTTGGAIIYEDGKFLYSHHATDPCGGQLVNAWDLVRLHKFSHLDDDAKERTPVVNLPSNKAMKELARSDKNVTMLLNKERQEAAKSYFEAIGQDDEKIDEEDDSWRLELTIDGQGNVERTMANIVHILDHDAKFKGKIYFDEFANRGMVELPLPWEKGEGCRLWSDVDDAQLALRLEKEYGITGREKIENAIKVVAFNNKRNAVKDYILSLEWDGENRIATLLHDYLGAEKTTYTDEVMRKALVAAVARAFSSKGVKFDNMVVFSGPQGIGKSTFLAKLGMEWFSDSLYSFEGKEAAELLQGTLINEVGELSALTKSETETIKQFLSKTHDIYREAYGRRTNKYPRRCVFFGSTNSESFLKDATGSRRFWPVRVGEVPKTKDVFTDLDKDVDQIWAEAYVYYMVGESLILSEEAEDTALEMQDLYRDEDAREGIIANFLEMMIPVDWYEMEPRDQRAFLYGAFRSEEEIELVERDKVCVAEIWQVCLGGDVKYLKRQDSSAIASILTSLPGWKRNKNPRHYGYYGKQKGFERTNVVSFNRMKRKKS